jgi:predicted signal transduction protein with EAL and GGDEF domain
MHEPENFQTTSLTERRFAAPLRRNFAIVTAVILLPFAIMNGLQGNYPTAIGTGLLVIVLIKSAVSLHRRGTTLWKGAGLMVFAVAAVYLSIYYQGAIGVFWSYPVVLLFHFSLNRRAALIGNVFYVAGVAPLAVYALGLPYGIRVFFTLLLTSAFAHIFSQRLVQQRDRLRHLALVDHLTGAFNRRYLDVCMATAVEAKKRYSTNASLLMIDVDHFKHINDNHGHKVGDEVLIELVKTIQARIRKTDQLFRMGGDEFVLDCGPGGGLENSPFDQLWRRRVVYGRGCRKLDAPR